MRQTRSSQAMTRRPSRACSRSRGAPLSSCRRRATLPRRAEHMLPASSCSIRRTGSKTDTRSSSRPIRRSANTAASCRRGPRERRRSCLRRGTSMAAVSNRVRRRSTVVRGPRPERDPKPPEPRPRSCCCRRSRHRGARSRRASAASGSPGRRTLRTKTSAALYELRTRGPDAT